MNGVNKMSANNKIYKKDWVFNAEVFEKLLFSLDENPEKASLIYEDIRQRLIRQFHASQSQIAEEQADEVFNRVARKIHEEDFVLNKNNPYPYFHQTARYILLEQQRSERRKILGLDDLSSAKEPFYELEEVLPVEADLLHRINNIFPYEKRRRYNELYAKFKNDELAKNEYEELLELSNEFEMLNAERLDYIGKLAELRGQSIEQLMEFFEITNSSNEHEVRFS